MVETVSNVQHALIGIAPCENRCAAVCKKKFGMTTGIEARSRCEGADAEFSPSG
jgi:hypothetical protein